MKKLFIFFLAFAASVGNLFAQVLIGGLYYNLYGTNLTAEVAYESSFSDSRSSYHCGEVVNIPATVNYEDKTYTVIGIGNRAFQGCSNLSSVTIPESVTSIGDYAFKSCGGLTSVTIPNSVTNIGDYAFHNCFGLKSVTISNSITSIGNYVFFGCRDLSSVTIPESVTSIGDYAFSKCSNLSSVTISNNVTSIGDYAFNECSNLSSVIIPDSVRSIGNYAFYKCHKLPSVTIPDNVLSIGYYSFAVCNGLKSVSIGNNVTSISENAFSNCNRLTSVTIGNGVTFIGNYAFCDCIELKDISIPNSVIEIGYHSFSGCHKITSIYIPTSVIRIGSGAFGNCRMLDTIIVDEDNPNFDSRESCNAIIETATNKLLIGCKTTIIPDDITRIAIEAFSKSRISDISIPKNVNKIGNRAFEECAQLQKITCHAIAPPEMGTDVFNKLNCKQIALYVPAQSVEAYKAAAQWKAFSIQAIGTEDALPEILMEENAQDGKFMIDGVLYIRKAGRVYDINGQELH